MSGYSHLTAEERDRLAGLMADGLSLRSIARALGRAASTISREIGRNALDSGAWLSDNGSMYTARDTRVFASQLNLVPCFTPVASPESNDMSKAFEKTLKRDYLHVSPVPDARTALDLIAGWFDDYNEHHPHSGLRMRSPREFRRAHQPAEVSG